MAWVIIIWIIENDPITADDEVPYAEYPDEPGEDDPDEDPDGNDVEDPDPDKEPYEDLMILMILLTMI